MMFVTATVGMTEATPVQMGGVPLKDDHGRITPRPA